MLKFSRALAGAFVAASLAAFVPSAAGAADKVSTGVLLAAGDMGLFIAEARGYFKAENLDVTLTHMYVDNAAMQLVRSPTSTRRCA